MALASTLGFPRVGRNRELKRACEAYWAGATPLEELRETAAALRRTHWETQRRAGIDVIPCNDFSFYDGVLDAIALIGAVPARYGWDGTTVDLDTYFAMARGAQRAGLDVTAMEMTKWFDTNYHYIVPEWHGSQSFSLASTKPLDELAEAQALGLAVRPVLVGPLTLALLGKPQDPSADVLGSILDGILTIYGIAIARLAAAGAQWIQLDEPCLVQDRSPEELAALRRAYEYLATQKGDAGLHVQTYFGHVGAAFETLCELPVEAIGLDFVRGAENLDLLRRYGVPEGTFLAAGVVDGRNVWRTDLDAALETLEDVADVVRPDHLLVTPSCSLLHAPYDARAEDTLDPTVRNWLAFAEQKLDEVVTLTRALNEGRDAVRDAFAHSAAIQEQRRTSPLARDEGVRRRLATSAPDERPPFAQRRAEQRRHLDLPLLPTTTIGSFPQTPEVRRTRRRFEAGEISQAEYESFVEATISDAIARQEQMGLDVLVHGEAERSDMVEYFGEQLSGFAFTRHGWVQSYGSRCVRPPIIFGDVARHGPMTVRWSAFAQSRTTKPMKGMLTGPVTILNWSYVRDDQPRSETCRQIAFALRDEVADLQAAGLRIIQIDEPALREGLPLRRADWAAYLEWAVACFRLAASSAAAGTQVHTHMCYCEFDDIIDAISALDADVLSIENSRSGGELLRVFERVGYDKEIGPGAYDIHSPRVPPVDEIAEMLRATLAVLPAERVWVNPDCGLKTRRWDEVTPSLQHLVEATRRLRAEVAATAAPDGAR